MAPRDWLRPEVVVQHLQVLLPPLAYKYEGRGKNRDTALHSKDESFPSKERPLLGRLESRRLRERVVIPRVFVLQLE
jgi:hypothetical protein